MVRLLISALVTVSLIVVLNTKISVVPPLGKFLDPVAGFWANADAGHGVADQLELDGLSRPVQVLYDSLLIPHIFAENDNDLYIAQGYITASHRLWQMEFQTHFAGGRISEIVGEVALELDRGQRRKGMVFGAQNFIDNLNPDAKTVLDSYANGVNQYISQLSYADYPLEYKLLGYAPEPWTTLKSALLYKYMSDMLNSHEEDLENTNFRKLYGQDLLDLLYPEVDNYDDPVVDRTNNWFEPIPSRDPASEEVDEITAFQLVERPHRNNGSNNWAVGPDRSATGNAFLCNDMHLTMYSPSLWYYTQLHAPGINVLGHSLPGMPNIITGFTDSIAWGFTNAQRDLVDWYYIEYESEKRNRYLLDGEYVDTEKVVEEIKINGAETYYDTVMYTVFGPVMYDRTFGNKEGLNGYARRWIDHDPSDGTTMFYKINRANNFEDYMAALDYFTSPAQNVVFASTQGDIAHRVQGKYPVRFDDKGRFLRDGTSSANNWQSYIPNEQNAFWKNPERGFVSSANQHPADSTYPYYVSSTSYEAYRNRRINDVLRADSSITFEDMKSLHYDNYSMKAAESLPFMLEHVDKASFNETEGEVFEELSSWDYYYHADSKGATYYNRWWRQLYGLLWDEITQSDVPLPYPTSYSTINMMINHPESSFIDNQGTPEKEDIGSILTTSFKKMASEVADWEAEKAEWGVFKNTQLGHMTRQAPLGNDGILAGGAGGDVVNASGSTHGPSERIIVELDPAGVKAWGHYPGGQSGNPGNKYYTTMIDAWANGTYYELKLLTSLEKTSDILTTQTIEPK